MNLQKGMLDNPGLVTKAVGNVLDKFVKVRIYLKISIQTIGINF